MSSFWPDHHQVMSPELAERLEAMCDRFEREWLAGPTPRLEDFLSLVEAIDRPVLLRVLLAMELEYRGRAGDQPRVGEYLARLPGFRTLVVDVFASLFPNGVRALSCPRAASAEQVAGGHDTPLTRAGRYELEAEIAWGGMGVVWRARDPELNRVLAVKVLRAEHRDPGLQRRFREEAQITGQLQHPGIPPILDVGTLPDGRPFIAMRLIKGQTLGELLAQRASPADDLSRFVGIFEQVAQTLAYAHSKHIIHRDVKPANILVGPFGEVQVVDWGLAKVLHKDEGGRMKAESSKDRSGPSFILPPSSLDGSHAGSVLGTPGYMAPEQARGEIDQIDERCDVFGLGAILCVLLTGHPPYRGSKADEIRARTVRGDLSDAHARLDHCDADPELVRLARACLEARRENRPRRAAEVARAVASYQAGVRQRLRETERQRVAAEARAAEEHKRRRLAVALAAAVVLLGVLASGTLWSYQRVGADRAERRARTEREVTQALAEVKAQIERAKGLAGSPDEWEKTLTLARLAALQAQRLLDTGEASAAVRQEVAQECARLDAAERDRQVIFEVDDIRLRLAETRGGNYDHAGMVQRYRESFLRFGLDIRAMEDPAEAARKLQSSSQPERLLAALGHWERFTSVEQERRQLESIARSADPDPGSLANRWRKAMLERDRETLAALSREAESRRLSPGVLHVLLADLHSLQLSDQAERLAREGLHRHPDDFWLNVELAFSRAGRTPPDLDEAVRYLTVARAVRRQSPVVHASLAWALKGKGKVDEAIACYRQAIALDPNYVWALVQLGHALHDRGRFDEAMVCFRKAIALDPKQASALKAVLDRIREK
jgi:serine/threonine-protein kinase